MKTTMKIKNSFPFLSLLNFLRAFGLAITQRVAANLSVVGWSARDRQRGATALEYIVLAAAVIIIVGVLATVFGGASNPLSDALSNLFEKAENISAGGGGTGGGD